MFDVFAPYGDLSRFTVSLLVSGLAAGQGLLQSMASGLGAWAQTVQRDLWMCSMLEYFGGFMCSSKWGL